MSSGVRHLVLGLVAVVAGAVALASALLRPPADEYGVLVMVLAAPAALAALAAPAMRRWVSTRRSIGGVALAVGLSSLPIGALASTAAARAMFLSGHDYRMFVVVLSLSAGIALVAGRRSQPVAADIHRLGIVAEAVADGDLTQRTLITRRDEVGRAADAVDRMVARLADARKREAVAGARQHLLSSVSHDLRTPLAAPRRDRGVRDGVAADPDRYLAVAERHLTTMERLLDQLHEFARIESGRVGTDRAVISLAELADEAVEALMPLADRQGVRLLAVSAGPAHVHVSAAEMSRVLRNLLDNAIRHSPSGGQVAITISGAGPIHLEVTDQGPGFPTEFRSIAFDPFTRAGAARASSDRPASASRSPRRSSRDTAARSRSAADRAAT
ncbi:MAG: HAMP domain-containing sensor histidine kinase [Ilumatobacteraceae bacterium]